MDTLLLDLTNWDLCVDAAGNWAVATAPYAIAQDVASACKTFQGEVYYDSTLGIFYFAKILGFNPPASLVAEALINAALTVPFVVPQPAPLVNFTSFVGRNLTGTLTFTDSITGNTSVVTLQ